MVRKIKTAFSLLSEYKGKPLLKPIFLDQNVSGVLTPFSPV